jgi:hypothetical protein
LTGCRNIENDSIRTFSVRILTIFLLFVMAASVSGQSQFTRIYGPQDQDVPLPQFVPATGTKDANALQTIQAFLAAVNTTAWAGIQASGTFTVVGSQQATPLAATLTIAGGDDFRLDLATPSGTQSIRIDGPFEVIQEADGKKHSLPTLAAKAGLLAFPKLLASEFSVANATILDNGMITISGGSLHRITVEEPLYASAAQATGANTSVMDLYFDPTSHLLIKSAVSVPISWSDRERYLEVTTYSNYQAVNGLLIPLICFRTINGQPEWTLQLNSVLPLPSLASSYFHF